MTVILFGFSLFVYQPNKKRVYELKKGILLSIGLYVIISVLLYFMGIENSHEWYGVRYESESIFAFGAQAMRKYFPLSSGINAFGGIVGAGFVVSFMMLRSLYLRVNEKIFIIIMIVFCGYALIGVQSRGAILGVLISIILVHVYPKRYFNSIATIIFFVPVLQHLLPFISASLSKYHIVKILGRGHANAMLEGRFFMWNLVWDKLSRFSLTNFIGFGIFGHAVSKISINYSSLFNPASPRNVELVNVHNFFLQQILDFGYIGTALIFLMLYKNIIYLSNEYKNSKNYLSRIFVTLLIYFIFTGFYDAIPTVYSTQTFFVFILVLISNISHVKTSIQKQIKYNIT